MITNVLSPNLRRGIIRKKYNFFFKFSPGNLLIILYQLTKFEAPHYNSFRDILNFKFSKSKSAKGDNSKNKINFIEFSQDNLLINLYQLTKFEAPSYNTFF